MGSTLSMPEDFVWPDPTRLELIFTSLLVGWQSGFGFLTGRNVWRLTSAMQNPWKSVFAWLCWAEFILNTTASVSFFILVVYEDSAKLMVFWTFLLVVIVWAVGTQIMLQIICNRLALIEPIPRRAKQIKYGTMALWGLFNISVGIIWIPARMMVSERWIKINEIWDRVEKIAYLFIDLGLNTYFIITVKKRLVDCGMQKYDRLIKFNIRIICASLLTDVLLVVSMSLPSPLVYMAFSCVCYTIKLNIELALGKLILTLAQEPTANIRLTEPERSRYEDVLDPYSVRSLRSAAIASANSDEKTVTSNSEESGIGNYRCGNCQATGSVVRRRKLRPARPPRSMFSSRDLESVDEIEADSDIEYELRSYKSVSVYSTSKEDAQWVEADNAGNSPAQPPMVYQVEVNGNMAGENARHPQF